MHEARQKIGAGSQKVLDTARLSGIIEDMENEEHEANILARYFGEAAPCLCCTYRTVCPQCVQIIGETSAMLANKGLPSAIESGWLSKAAYDAALQLYIDILPVEVFPEPEMIQIL